jgi:hypothetical protein
MDVSPAPDPRLIHNQGAGRYELWLGDELASVAEYNPRDGTLVFDHTQTLPRFRGRGLAERLVAFALEDVRTRGRLIEPACWFVADFVQQNPEYAELLATPPSA